MDVDDLEPRPGPQGKKDLENMSIEALQDYIDQLRAEIDRAQAEIQKKHAARAGAEAVFKF